MAPTLRKHANIHLTDITTQQHAAQAANARPLHVDETKPLTSGMRAAGSGSTLPQHDDKENFMPGIAERAKERRRQSDMSLWSPPRKLPETRRRGKNSFPRVQSVSSEVLGEMSVQTAFQSPPPTASAHTAIVSLKLKRRASVEQAQRTSLKRARSNSAEPVPVRDLSHVGHCSTDPSLSTSTPETVNPLAHNLDVETYAKPLPQLPNPLHMPQLFKSDPGHGLSMLARAAAVAETSPIIPAESIVVRLPVALPALDHSHPTMSFDTVSDGTATLVDENEGASDGFSVGQTPATDVTSAPSPAAGSDHAVEDMEIDAMELREAGTAVSDGVGPKTDIDLSQPTPYAEADIDELQESMVIGRAETPDIEVAQPTANIAHLAPQEVTRPHPPPDAEAEQNQASASSPSSKLVISLSPEAANRARQIIATSPASTSIPVARAFHGPLNADDQFVADVIVHIEKQSRWKTKTVAKDQARRILDVLRPAKEGSKSEALFLSCEEARRQLETNVFFPGPIFVDGAQPMELDTVEKFLNEYYDDSLKVWIQDPSILVSRGIPHAREVTIKQLKERFAKGKAKIPWNCLELAAHVEDGLRPSFLNNEDCRLLTKLKIPSSEDHTSRRGFEAGYKEIEKWALLAQAGSLTSPHQDSHGYSTYITVNQGIVGFGWLSNPTEAERTQWLKNPSAFKDGNWRYKILRPGQTVYFPSGTVHFVFRLHSASDTLAFGGHVLRCSQIVSWVKTLIEERMHGDVTNEDITVSAPGYLERVARFVKQARRMSQEEKWGGAQAIVEFLRLKDKFMGMK